MPQVRKMTKEDLDQVAAIAALAFVKPWSRQGFAEALPMENACFLVVDDNGSVAGYCGLYMAADEGEIINVAVKPDFRRKGIADQLMKALLTEGIRNGVCRFFLEVRVSNSAAIRLYQKHGFVKQGIRKDFYKEIHEDAYIMNRISEIM